MDTKTPPIPLKVQEKSKPRQQEIVADVSLPPLTPYRNHRQKQKTAGTQWSRDVPSAIRYQDHQKKRPYRVLQIGATPLMHACQQGDRTRVLRLLKEQEETIGYRDRTLRNALHYCMDAGTAGAVAAAAPELVNAPDAEGHTPLHLAVIAGDTQLVAVLLANGADVNAKDLEGHSVLHWATVCGEAECVRLVLAAGARPSTPDLRGGSPLHYAAQCCGAAATAELAVPKKVGLKVLQTLLEFGADVNAKDEDGRQPILWAASAGSVEAVLALARAGGSAAAGAADKDGLTALHCAASRGHARCVEALVNLCGAHPDHVDDNGCSALHYAATLGHADATALILKLGSDPNRQDRKGRTPALCAAAKGQLETLKILAQHGGSLYARTVRGTGVAHEAVASGRIELIKWLAKKRPSTLDVATHDGKTPLHVAALHGHLDVCKVLLDNGARINAVLRTSKGNLMTALDAALYRGHRDCAKLIQMHGGTTAQQLRMQKTVPNKVFAAKLRMKRMDSSTDTESSPRRRGRSNKLPELYYEEQWIEKRTRRRGNSRKLARQDSRSFSEEEVRLSKTSSQRDHLRRARSESARYEDDDTDRKLRRKRSKIRSKKSKRESSESPTESDSCDPGENASRPNDESRREESKTSGSNGTHGREDLANDDENDENDESDVSDDSLEVVVVRKSLEKKCEKVVSGRRSKTPRESSKEMKFTKTHRSTRRKLKSNRSKTSDNGESTNDRIQSLGKEQESKESAIRCQETPRTSMDDDRGSKEKITESRYRRDVTDSTSQETVERVVVTAMVHKDQGPDTPKSVVESSKEVTFDDKLRTEVLETEETFRDNSSNARKVDDILEQTDESRSNLMTKAANLKKDVEGMRQQVAHEKTQRRKDSGRSEKDKVDNKGQEREDGTRDRAKYDVKKDQGKEMAKEDQDSKGTRENRKEKLGTTIIEKEKVGEDKDEGVQGRLNSHETNESERSTLDSQKENQRENDLASKSERTTLEMKSDDSQYKEIHSDKTEESEHTSKEDHEESERTSKSESPMSQKDTRIECTTPRTAVQDVPLSEEDDKKSTSDEGKSKTRNKSGTIRRKTSVDEKRSKSSSSRQSDESPKTNGGSQRRKEFSKKRESSTKKVSVKSTTEKTSNEFAEKTSESQRIEEKVTTESIQEKEATSMLVETPSKESQDEKEQADSVREKSVELSSSNDSVLMEEPEDRSLGADAPIATKRKMSVQKETVEDSFPPGSGPTEKNENEEDEAKKVKKRPVEDALTTEEENFRYIDESSSGSPKSRQTRRSRPSTGKIRKSGRSVSRSPTKKCLFESSEERSPDRSAIVAVIESPEWDEDDEEIDKEIRDAIGEDGEHETEPEEDNEMGVVRVIPSTSEEETIRTGHDVYRSSATDSLPQVQASTRTRLTRILSPQESRTSRLQGKQRRDSGGRDSGIEPSPRVSRIPRRRIMKCCPNTEKQQTLNMETITRDVQISLRRYHLERKIFFQLMELKRLQIRHGRANEQVLVKRQVDAFHKAGMSGPTLGVAKYDLPLTFRHFEAFLYDQLRKLQKRPATPDFCTEAKQCTQKTHRCHHATSAYTSFPVYTYLGGGGQEQTDLLPKIESRGKGQMTVEVTHGEEKQIIALPTEKLDRTKKYYVTFTVKGEAQQEIDKPKSSVGVRRIVKSV